MDLVDNPLHTKVLARPRSVPQHRRRFLEHFFRAIAHGCFGEQYLHNLTNIGVDRFPAELSFSLRVSRSLCREREGCEGAKEGVCMSTAALLALFDDLSTAALVAQDRSLRPGVSVSLSAEVFADIPADGEVLVVARADKIGRVLGFASMELWDTQREKDTLTGAHTHTHTHTDARKETHTSTQRGTQQRGKLLARGRHVKYLPMGWLWDSLLGSALFVSLFLWLYEWWRGRGKGDELDRLLTVFTKEDRLTHKHKHQHTHHNKQKQDEGEKRSDALTTQREESEALASLFSSLHVTNVALEEYPKLLPAAHERARQLYALFQFRVKPFMHNGVGSCHGGAVAVAIEEACVLSRRKLSERGGRAIKIVSMDVRYLAAMKGELLIKVVDDEHAGVLHTSEGENTKVFRQSIGAVLSKKKLMVCAEFTCCWAWDE